MDVDLNSPSPVHDTAWSCAFLRGSSWESKRPLGDHAML